MTQESNNIKRVLVFNPFKRLVSIYQSTFAVAKSHDWNLSSIRSACSGKIITYKKLYFRYLDDSIEVGIEDLGTLNLEEYDDLCGVQRKVYPDSKISRKGMKYTKKPKTKSPYYPFNKPLNTTQEQ